MADIFKKADEAKEKYLEQATHANDAAASGAKLTDLYDKGSSVYKDANPEKRAPTPMPEIPTTDAEGYPIIDQVHTYKEDLAGIVNRDKLSLSRIAMMEGTANKGLEKTIVPVKKQVNLLLIISIILGVLGIGIIGGVFMLAMQQNSPEQTSVDLTPAPRYIIFSETRELLPIVGSTKTQIGAQINALAQSFREEGSVMEIIPAQGNSTTTPDRVSINDLFNATDARMPDSLARSLIPQFFLGLYSQKGTSYPFLLYYVDSYDIAYPGMLEWEGFMPGDIGWLFNTRPQTSGTTTVPLSFKDRVIANSDARSYEDASGKTAFFYLFLDDRTLLIARTADTVRMVQDRIRKAKFQ